MGSNEIKLRLQELTKNIEVMKAKKIQLETELSLKESQLNEDMQELQVNSVDEATAARDKILAEIESLSVDYESTLSNIKSVLGSLND